MTGQDDESAKLGAAWLSYGQPGPEHELLARFAGVWEQDNEIWAFPGAPAQKLRSRSDMTLLYGGRYLQQVMKGGIEIPGMIIEFEGRGWFGFDNFSRRHFFSWIDNSTTMLMHGEGTADADGRISYFGEIPDARTGETLTFKAELWKEGDDRFMFDNFTLLPDGSWFLRMRMVSHRSV